MKVYVSVPMMGKPDLNRAYARRMQEEVERLGATAVVPHDILPFEHGDTPCPPGYSADGAHSSACYLRTDLVALLHCDAILLGTGWEGSVGCRAELQVATLCGIRVLMFEDFLNDIITTEMDHVLSFKGGIHVK